MQEVKIEVLSFKDSLVEFKVSNGEESYTATTRLDWNLLDIFERGVLVINPTHWYDSQDDSASKPDWFKRKELFRLNNVFEEYLLCSGCS